MLQYYNPSKVTDSIPILLADAKEQLNILVGETTDDVFISKVINRAIGIGEDYIEKDINEKTVTVVIDSKEVLHLEDGYIKSITSIEDDQAQAVTFTAEFWPDYSLVTLDTIPDGKVTVIYKTGWIEAELPESIKAAVLLKVGELYDIDRNNHSANNIKTSEQFESVLRYHKKLRL